MTNKEIAKILYEMAIFYDMDDVAFKPRAYEKAALAIESFDDNVEDIYKQEGEKGLFGIAGVGRGIADHIVEMLNTKKLKLHEKLKEKYPVDIGALTSIEGVGPKTVKTLYFKLKIRNIADLRKAALAHKLSKLPHFGKKSEEKILQNLHNLDPTAKRFLLGDIFGPVVALREGLLRSKLFRKLEVGGSFRRRQESAGDIDLLGIARNPKKAMDFFVKQKGVTRVIQHGEDKSEIVWQDGLQVDLRLIDEQSWGAGFIYFTGNKAHNVKLRKIAIEKGWKLSEYGIFKEKSAKRIVKSATEKGVYNALGMDYIEPELRNDTGEIEAALRGELPKILPYGSIRGDLQIQTNWTDGANSIEEMAKAAAKLGREYICITDHTKTLYMTGGLDENKLQKQWKEIDRVNSKLQKTNPKFRILKGAEVNILKDGSLDINDKTLAKLDVVGVSVHSHFKMARRDMTERIVRALSNPNTDIFFHPTTRLIQKRVPIDFDFDEILKVAKKNKVALEVNAYPERLDIHDTLIRQAVEAGVRMVIDTDAHHVKHLEYIHFGEAQARRGWARKSDVLNTGSAEALLGHFKDRKRGSRS